MQNESRVQQHEPESILARAMEYRRAREWKKFSELAERIPRVPDASWVPALDAVAFGLGLAGQRVRASELLETAFSLAPGPRLASAIAYQFYAVLLDAKSRRRGGEALVRGHERFELWMGRALELDPDSLVDRYRLGVYHASIRSRRDVAALACFADVLRLWRRLDAGRRTDRDPLFKIYVWTLFAAGRSALRLGRLADARRFSFACIRADRERQHVAEVFKLHLAAKVLVAQGNHTDAERGLRKALEVPHEGDRDFVYGLLAEIALANERPTDARLWIADHILPHRRKPYLWRLLGEAELRLGNRKAAIAALRTSLLKDRMGRHKTLVLIGRLQEERGRLREARRSFRDAADFRSRKFSSEDQDALEALASVCERMGDIEGAKKALVRLSRLPLVAEHAHRELQRLTA